MEGILGDEASQLTEALDQVEWRELRAPAKFVMEIETDWLWWISHDDMHWAQPLASAMRIRLPVIKTAVTDIQQVDITRFFGILAKESERYSSLCEFSSMVLSHGGGNIKFASPEDLAHNLRTIRDQGTHGVFDADFRAWDGRLFWYNLNRGHHFAALYRQSREQNLVTELPCRVRVHYLEVPRPPDHDAGTMYCIDCETGWQIWERMAAVGHANDLEFNVNRDSGLGLLIVPSGEWYSAILLNRLKRNTECAIDFESLLDEASTRQDDELRKSGWARWAV